MKVNLYVASLNEMEMPRPSGQMGKADVTG